MDEKYNEIYAKSQAIRISEKENMVTNKLDQIEFTELSLDEAETIINLFSGLDGYLVKILERQKKK
jgi:hypothetical protein